MLALKHQHLAFFFNFIRADRWLIPVVLFGSLFVGVCVSVFLKIWPATPDWVEPTVRVSLFDHLQARSLAHKALENSQSGRHEEAKSAWLLAIANHPGKPEYLRGLLREVPHLPPSLELGQETIAYTAWLQRLTRTNRSELKLILNGLEHCHRYNRILEHADREGSLPHSRSAAFLRALFHTGQYQSFAANWKLAEPEIREDSLMKLYHLAVTAIRTQKAADYTALKEAYDPIDAYQPHYLKSRQLALRAHAFGAHTRSCRAILKDLRKRNQAMLSDYLFYWHVLIRNGLVDRIAQEYKDVPAPQSELEAIALIRTLRKAGLYDASLRVAKETLDTLGAMAPRLWVDYGNLLVEEELWLELNRVASQIQTSSVLSQIKPIANFWEALTAWSADRHDRAQDLFEQIADSPPDSPIMRIQLAAKLHGLGQNEAADSLIEDITGEDNRIRGYWLQRAGTAYRAQELDEFSNAVAAAYEFDPSFDPFINNYLVMLITKRENPQKALELSRQLLEAQPDFVPYRLNRAHALILAEQFEAADTLLGGLGPLQLTDADLQEDYQLGLFRLAVGRKQFKHVLRLADTLNRSKLLPDTEAWIAKQVEIARMASQE